MGEFRRVPSSRIRSTPVVLRILGVVLGRNVSPKKSGLRARTCSMPRVKKSRSRLRSEEHTSELQSLMRISYAVFCLKKKKQKHSIQTTTRMNMNIKQKTKPTRHEVLTQ